MKCQEISRLWYFGLLCIYTYTVTVNLELKIFILVLEWTLKTHSICISKSYTNTVLIVGIARAIRDMCPKYRVSCCWSMLNVSFMIEQDKAEYNPYFAMYMNLGFRNYKQTSG